MVANPLERLTELLQGFVSCQDRSLEYVHEIEGLLIEHFQNDDNIFEELSEPVARYAPGGGEQLYDEEELANVFKHYLSSLGLTLHSRAF